MMTSYLRGGGVHRHLTLFSFRFSFLLPLHFPNNDMDCHLQLNLAT